MIEVKNLTKVFKSKHKQQLIALDDVSFNLPDAGFVFIIGKSGSGKTTLLSILGGLDSYNKGNIKINGYKLNELKTNEFNYYRNEIVGFIFQNFYLLDNLTVKENIKLSLDMQSIKSDDLIDKALKEVELEGYGMRYPYELSGGEQQRVAIARALIKNPKLILADEPTGNLDSKTTKQILEILKKISKDRLVLIVSHNAYDAYQFADYILELNQGKIVNRFIRNKNSIKPIEIEDSTLRIPWHNKINEEDEALALKALENNDINNIIQDDQAFIPDSNDYSEKIEDNQIKKSHIKLFKAIGYGLSFTKKGFFTMLFYSFIIATIIATMGLIFSILDFNYNLANLDYFKDDDALYVPINTPHYDENDVSINSYEITDNQLDVIYNSDYQGEIFKGYEDFMSFSQTFNSFGSVIAPKSIYKISSFADISLILFGKQQELQFVYQNPLQKGYGIYILDIQADSILNNNRSTIRSYQELANTYYNKYNKYLNGIINTSYKDKYLDCYQIMTDSTISIDQKRHNLYKSPNVDKFLRDFGNILTMGFTFQDNYLTGVFEEGLKRPSFVMEGPLLFSYNGNNILANEHYISSLSSDYNCIPYKYYNKFTGKNIELGFNSIVEIEPIKIHLRLEFTKIYPHRIIEKDIVFTHATSSSICLNKKDAIDIYSNNGYLHSLLLEKQGDIKYINELVEESGLEFNYLLSSTTRQMSKLKRILDDVFKLIIIVLSLAAILAISFYSISMVKNRRYEIGLFKALGARNKDILALITINLLSVFGFIILFYILQSFLLIRLANFVLSRSLTKSSLTLILNRYNYLGFNLSSILNNIVVVLIVCFVSFLTPLIKLRRTKPINIIKESK